MEQSDSDLMDDIRLTKWIFNFDHANANNNSWSSEMKRTFTRLDMLDSYETKSTVNINALRQKLFYSTLNHG